jgi:hypothetical protein
MAEPTRSSPGHETHDVSVRLISWFAVGLVFATLVIYAGVASLYRFFEQQHPSPDTPSRIALHPHPVAPLPRLQTNPALDLAQYEAAQRSKLNTYGWIDRPAGIIHIPIARAIDLTLERGLPTRGPGTQNASGITPVQMQTRKAAVTKP